MKHRFRLRKGYTGRFPVETLDGSVHVVSHREDFVIDPALLGPHAELFDDLGPDVAAKILVNVGAVDVEIAPGKDGEFATVDDEVSIVPVSEQPASKPTSKLVSKSGSKASSKPSVRRGRSRKVAK